MKRRLLKMKKMNFMERQKGDKTMQELAAVLNQFGVTALWGIVLYKLLDFAGFVGVFLIVYLGIKKAWPHFKEWTETM